MYQPYAHFSCLQDVDLTQYPKFYLGGRHIGWVEPKLVALYDIAEPGLMLPFRSGYTLNATNDQDFATRTEALARCFQYALDAGLNTHPPHGEHLPISPEFDLADPVASWDRNSGAFIASGRGVSGIVYTVIGGEKHIWLGQRSDTRRFFPGKWDSVVSGGVKAGSTIEESLTAEAYEEAGIDAALARQFTPGASQVYANTIYGYPYVDLWRSFELEVSNDFRPVCTDKSVQEVRLCGPAAIAAMLDDGSIWRPDSAGTVMDFCLRHNIIPLAPDDKKRVQSYLTRPLPFEA